MNINNLVLPFRISFLLDINDKFGKWFDDESYNEREERIDEFYEKLGEKFNLREWDQCHHNIHVEIESVNEIKNIQEKIFEFIKSYDFKSKGDN